MIFATVGHHSEGFQRLVRKLDEIAPEIDEEIILQAGYTAYQPRNIQYFAFKPYGEVMQLMREARVIVCHGGACVMDGLMLGKPLIVVPRRRKYNELIDDHQAILAEKLGEAGNVEVVLDVNNLKGHIQKAQLAREAIKSDNRLVNYLREQVGNLLGASEKGGL